jgi:hypothetical protein
MIKIYTQGESDNAELFSLVGELALSPEVHEKLGISVSSVNGDIWFVATEKSVCVGFGQIRKMKNGNAHMRYLYSEYDNHKLAILNKIVDHCQKAGVKTLYTNERKESPVLKDGGLSISKDNARGEFFKWERSFE